MILYDLAGKSNSERTRILQKLYGGKERSNYHYTYQRAGLVDKRVKKVRKTVLYVRDEEEAKSVSEMLKKLKVSFEKVGTY